MNDSTGLMDVYLYPSRRRPIQRESREQQSVVLYARLKWPEVPIVCSTGGKKMSGRTKWARIKQGATNKREGYEKGTPDLFFSAAHRGFHGLYIEMKDRDETPSSITPDQNAWGIRAQRQGYAWFACFGSNEAVKILEWYFNENHCAKSA